MLVAGTRHRHTEMYGHNVVKQIVKQMWLENVVTEMLLIRLLKSAVNKYCQTCF